MTEDVIYYRDTGCKDGGPSCLECPLPRCIHDEGPMFVFLKNQRAKDARIANAVHGLDLDLLQAVTVVAQENGVTRRTIFRILQRQREL